jgi:TolB-like protein
VLKTELDVQPGTETRRLNAEILEGHLHQQGYPPPGTLPDTNLNVDASLNRYHIAVLPFVNMSPEPDNEYFSDGMADELINALTKIEGLQVISRTSALAFKGKNEDLRTIGAKLKVGTVLEGSVRKAGNKLRISVQLINVADGYHL